MIALGAVNGAAIVVGLGIARRQVGGLALLVKIDAAVENRGRVLGIKPAGLVKILVGLVQLIKPGISTAAVVVGLGIGLELQGFAVVGHGHLQLALVEIGIAALPI